MKPIPVRDLKIEVFRHSQPGWATDLTQPSHIKITHLPTGLSVTSDSEKSQLQNRAKAVKELTDLVRSLNEPEKPEPILDRAEDLEQAVFTAIGAASMCWGEIPKGVFDSTRAKQIGEELCEWIRASWMLKEQ